MNERLDLLVIGAGPAGLAHAFWQQREDDSRDIAVVDSRSEPGGWVRSESIDGFLCETGPQGIRPDAASDAVIEALDLGAQVIAADESAKQRYLARGGTLHPLPAGPKQLLSTDVFTLVGKLSLCLEPLRRRLRHPGDAAADGGESLAEFVRRRFGEQAVPLAEAMASGIFAGDAHELEMNAAFPAVTELERHHGSLILGMIAKRRASKRSSTQNKTRPAMATFVGGMHTLVEAFTESLGSRLMTDLEARSLRQTDGGWALTFADGSTRETRNLVLATPARVSAKLLSDVDGELAADLTATPFASVANVYLGFAGQEAADTLRGFGFILDRSEALPVLGTIFCSSIFPDCAPSGHSLCRVMIGGVLHPDAVDRDDEQLVATAEAMLRRYTGLRAERVFAHVSRARDAIPQFVKGHRARLRRVRERERALTGLQLIGSSYDEVSVVGQLRKGPREP